MPTTGEGFRSRPSVDRGAVSVAEAFNALGLDPTADRAKVRAAYRRLAFQHHPDRNPGDPLSAERFQRLTKAHDVLETMFVLADNGVLSGNTVAGQCEYCGNYTILTPAMDGTQCCADCLILAGGHRRLPAPTVVVVSCGFTIVTLTAAVAFLVLELLDTGSGYCFAALLAGLLANISLAITCLTVVHTARPEDLSRRH